MTEFKPGDRVRLKNPPEALGGDTPIFVDSSFSMDTVCVVLAPRGLVRPYSGPHVAVKRIDGDWDWVHPDLLELVEADPAPGVRATSLPWHDEAEARVTDEGTGGQKGEKLAQLGAVDPVALYLLAQVAGMGARKYGERYNYLRGYDWSLSIDAAFRHMLKMAAGEDLDPESGLPHVTHAAWHMLALTSFLERGLGTDNRFHQDGESDDA